MQDDLKEYHITVMREERRQHTFRVLAQDSDEAEQIAEEEAGELNWSEEAMMVTANEQVIGIKEVLKT